VRELKVTPEGMVGIWVGPLRYSLYYSVVGNKSWAEHQDVTFSEILNSGWSPSALEKEDLGALLLIGLAGGELRRHLCSGSESYTVDQDLVDQIFGRYHITEISGAILTAWNQAAVPKDPPMPPETE